MSFGDRSIHIPVFVTSQCLPVIFLSIFSSMTAGVVGGLSTVAMCAPSDKFMNMGAPLGVGFGVVFASCIGVYPMLQMLCVLVSASGVLANLNKICDFSGSYFLPPTSLAGASLHSIALYGGVVLFSMLLLYQTQGLVNKAQVVPAYHQFDPIDS